jgi:hypothetical protein
VELKFLLKCLFLAGIKIIELKEVE